MTSLKEYLPIKVGDKLLVHNTDIYGNSLICTRRITIVSLDRPNNLARIFFDDDPRLTAEIPTEGPYVQGYASLPTRYQHDGFESQFVIAETEIGTASQ